MADEPLTIRGINWRETFPFTNLFRAFRVAIHPSKLVLALAALLLLYVGGRVLDGLWLVADRAVPGEVVAFEAFQTGSHSGQKFDDFRKMQRERVETEYAAILQKYRLIEDHDSAMKAAHNGDALGRIKDALIQVRDAAKKEADKTHDVELAAVKKLSGDAQSAAKKGADDRYTSTVQSAFEN